jgi:uncharacterized protein
MDLDFSLVSIVLQPTSLCNLNCKYCYLPQRSENLKMDHLVTRNLASDLRNLKHRVRIIWHGGEPLACGLSYFRRLIQPFSELEGKGLITHVVQTNATLIDERWCEFFKSHNFHVGISIDGPLWANTNRITWGGRETFNQALRGTQRLKNAHINFSAIAVVSDELMDKASAIYEFFCDLGCSSLGINIEEKEGVNQRNTGDDERVSGFWRELFRAWRQSPRIEIREFRRVLSWMRHVCKADNDKRESLVFDIIPTIGYNGDVVLLSPELLGTESASYDNFIVGNVCNQSLLSIIERWKEIAYVRDFVEGIRTCKKECAHFSHCRGGQASNKFFELGTTNGTETAFCRNSKKRLVSAVLDAI